MAVSFNPVRYSCPNACKSPKFGLGLGARPASVKPIKSAAMMRAKPHSAKTKKRAHKLLSQRAIFVQPLNMSGGRPVLIFVNHSARVQRIAAAHGWLPGARYTNLRDVRQFKKLGFLDIDWKNYDFRRHLEAAARTRPMITVARDIEDRRSLHRIIDQAYRLKEYAQHSFLCRKTRSWRPS